MPLLLIMRATAPFQMIGQGLEQARLWTGIEVQESLREAARAAVRNAISQKYKL
jgi:hypothetical protein